MGDDDNLPPEVQAKIDDYFVNMTFPVMVEIFIVPVTSPELTTLVHRITGSLRMFILVLTRVIWR